MTGESRRWHRRVLLRWVSRAMDTTKSTWSGHWSRSGRRSSSSTKLVSSCPVGRFVAVSSLSLQRRGWVLLLQLLLLLQLVLLLLLLQLLPLLNLCLRLNLKDVERERRRLVSLHWVRVINAVLQDRATEVREACVFCGNVQSALCSHLINRSNENTRKESKRAIFPQENLDSACHVPERRNQQNAEPLRGP